MEHKEFKFIENRVICLLGRVQLYLNMLINRLIARDPHSIYNEGSQYLSKTDQGGWEGYRGISLQRMLWDYNLVDINYYTNCFLFPSQKSMLVMR